MRRTRFKYGRDLFFITYLTPSIAIKHILSEHGMAATVSHHAESWILITRRETPRRLANIRLVATFHTGPLTIKMLHRSEFTYTLSVDSASVASISLPSNNLQFPTYDDVTAIPSSNRRMRVRVMNNFLIIQFSNGMVRLYWLNISFFMSATTRIVYIVADPNSLLRI